MSLFNRRADRAILYILNSGSLYGTERMALATLSGLDEYPRRVVFAPSAHGSGSVLDAARAAGMETVIFNSRFQLINGLVQWLLRHRAVDVIGTGVGQTLICHVLAKLFFVHVRQLHVAHGGMEDQHSYGRKHFLNWLPVQVVAVSDFVRHKLIKHGVRPQAIRVINNFLPDLRFDGHIGRPPFDPVGGRPISSSAVRVVVVSRIDSIKRIDVLVGALEVHGLVEFQFDIYGTGADLESLRARSAPLLNINFHGFVADVAERLLEADFLLHLCPVEPFGLAILESFRSRLVTIVPDSGGAGSLVDDGVTGLRFQANDVDDLARVLRHARRLTPHALQELADAGRAALDGRFSQLEGVRRYREALRAA